MLETLSPKVQWAFESAIVVTIVVTIATHSHVSSQMCLPVGNYSFGRCPLFFSSLVCLFCFLIACGSNVRFENRNQTLDTRFFILFCQTDRVSQAFFINYFTWKLILRFQLFSTAVVVVCCHCCCACLLFSCPLSKRKIQLFPTNAFFLLRKVFKLELSDLLVCFQTFHPTTWSFVIMLSCVCWWLCVGLISICFSWTDFTKNSVRFLLL